MRILILGGTRFIGPHLVRRLLEWGHDIALFHRGPLEPQLPTTILHIHGDSRRLPDHETAFRRFSPEVVVATHAHTESQGQALIRTFQGMAGRLVALSSGDVYRAYDRFRKTDPGPPDPVPLGEDSPLRDRLFPYRHLARTPEDPGFEYEKILVERAVMGNPSLPGTVLRLPMVYGPGDSQHRLFPYLKRMDDGRPAILLPDGFAGWRAPRGYVENVAEAIARAVTDPRAAARIYNVAETEPPTEAEWVGRIAKAASWKGRIVPLAQDSLPEHLKVPYETGQDWTLDSSRIRSELGFLEVVSPEDAMSRTLSWERQNPPDPVDAAEFDYPAEDRALAAAGEPHPGKATPWA